MVAKHEEMTGKRIFADDAFDQREQAIESLPHIRWFHGQKHASRAGKTQHVRTATGAEGRSACWTC